MPTQLFYPGAPAYPGIIIPFTGVLMAIVPTVQSSLTGVGVTPAAASAGGDRVAPGSRVHVVNAGGGSITCTIATPGKVRGLDINDQVVTIPNGGFPTGFRFFDVPADLYADYAVDGLVGLAWSATASVTFWVEGPVIS